MLNIVTMLGQAGAEGIIYDWNTVYDLLLELTQNSGFDEPQRFWLNPRTPEGQAAIARLQEAKSQPSADDLKKQAETQEIGQRVQLDAQQMKAEYEMKMAEMDVRRREAAVKEREVDLEQQKIELKRYEIEVKHAATVAEIQLEMSQGRPVGIGDRQIPNSTDGNIPSL
jgi:multidrug efflux pump subunit AcrA (membrane-fusion protein)